MSNIGRWARDCCPNSDVAVVQLFGGPWDGWLFLRDGPRDRWAELYADDGRVELRSCDAWCSVAGLKDLIWSLWICLAEIGNLQVLLLHKFRIVYMNLGQSISNQDAHLVHLACEEAILWRAWQRYPAKSLHRFGPHTCRCCLFPRDHFCETLGCSQARFKWFQMHASDKPNHTHTLPLTGKTRCGKRRQRRAWKNLDCSRTDYEQT